MKTALLVQTAILIISTFMYLIFSIIGAYSKNYNKKVWRTATWSFCVACGSMVTIVLLLICMAIW